MAPEVRIWSAFAVILFFVLFLKGAGYLLELEWIRQAARARGWTLVKVKKLWWRSNRIASYYQVTCVDVLGRQHQLTCRVIPWGKVDWIRPF